jgi:hypothetical protein
MIPLGVIRSVPETRQMIEQSMREIFQVARARQIALPYRVVEKSLALVDSLASGGTTSLQRDIPSGRPLCVHCHTLRISKGYLRVSSRGAANTRSSTSSPLGRLRDGATLGFERPFG